MSDPTLASLLADLEAERAELDVTIAHLRRRAGFAPGNEGSAAPSTNGGSRDMNAGRDTAVIVGRVRPDEFFRLSIADAITKYLGIMKQPQNPMAVVNGLKAGGVLTNAKNFYANVNTELKRMRARDLVVNTPSGWGLADWYPSKPKQPEPVKKKGKKRGRPRKTITAKTASTVKPAPSGHAHDAAMTWNQFAGAAVHAGKSLKEAAAEWKQRKAKASVE